MGGNILFGLQNIGTNALVLARSVFLNQLVWGFALGFALSTIMYLFVASERPSHIPAYIGKNQMKSFQSLSQQGSDGTYQVSYSSFKKEHSKIRTVFWFAGGALIVLVLSLLFRF